MKTTEIKFEGKTVNVNAMLPLKERASLIQSAADMVFAEGADSIDGYMPAYKRFAVRYAIIRYFTDIELPSELEEVAQIVCYSDLFSRVTEAVCAKQICGIMEDINDLISARKEALIRQSITSKMLKSINGTVDKLGGQLKDIDIGALLETLSKLPDTGSNGFLQSIVKGIGAAGNSKGE